MTYRKSAAEYAADFLMHKTGKLSNLCTPFERERKTGKAEETGKQKKGES